MTSWSNPFRGRVQTDGRFIIQLAIVDTQILNVIYNREEGVVLRLHVQLSRTFTIFEWHEGIFLTRIFYVSHVRLLDNRN